MQLGHGSVGFQLSLQSAYAEIAFRAERKAGRYADWTSDSFLLSTRFVCR